MANTDIGHGFEPTRGSVLRWSAFAVLAGVAVLLLGSQLHEALRRAPSAAPMAYGSVSQAHCVQFIELARAKFGPDWKYRLDPRDTTCARQIQEQWQHEYNERAPLQPPPPATLPVIEPSAPTYTAPNPDEVRARNPDTYCLNVISLARSRYGADWVSRLSPEEAASCGDAIRRVSGQ